MNRPILTTEQKHQLEAILARILDSYPINPDLVTHVRANFAAELDNWSGPDWFTLGYTGWRGADRDRVREDLTAVRTRVGPLRLIVGYDPDQQEPKGGDEHAYEWGLEAPGVIVETYPAPWHLPELGRAAGPYRNGRMIQQVLAASGQRGYVAHLHEESRGAAGTAAYAAHLGLDVWRRPAV